MFRSFRIFRRMLGGKWFLCVHISFQNFWFWMKEEEQCPTDIGLVSVDGTEDHGPLTWVGLWFHRHKWRCTDEGSANPRRHCPICGKREIYRIRDGCDKEWEPGPE